LKVLIKAGAEIDVPTRAEVAEDIHSAWRASEAHHEMERARGLKWIRASQPGPLPLASTLFLPTGPDTGYLWTAMLLSVQLASAGTVLAYVTSAAPSTSSTPLRLIWNASTSSANQVTTFGRGAVMLNQAESVYLSATQNITAWLLAGWEVPSEMAWKLL
jgi:hypothetical protein